MIAELALLALAASTDGGHELNAGALPVCANRVIGSVVQRAGCTVGDGRCWFRSGGFCTDYVRDRVKADGGDAPGLQGIRAEEVRQGDVAVFAARAHYAYVEAVIRDEKGTPIAVDLSEYNFGTCWVDRDFMVTEQYKVLGRRRHVALRDVDGGFLRAPRSAR